MRRSFLQPDYDIVICGGSVSGLAAAKEASRLGVSVKLLEEDGEIGLPEKCDGLVSGRSLFELGVVSSRRIVQNRIGRALLHSPSGITLEINAEKQGVIVLDRREFDRELARQSSRNGVEIAVAQRVVTAKQKDGLVEIHTQRDEIAARLFIDAGGYSSLTKSGHSKVYPAARYDVYAPWVESDTVELFFDQRVSPGFFTWIIPISNDTAKIGVAGSTLNPTKVLDEFIMQKGGGQVLKKIGAPIIVGGAIKRFIDGKKIVVGDAAGQCKPTTAGGIYTGGMGGLLAGKAATESIIQSDYLILEEYEKEWRRRFEKEFRTMLYARNILAKLGNKEIDGLFRTLNESNVMNEISIDGDFDKHSIALLKSLGLKKVIQLASTVAAKELTSFLRFLRGQKG